MSLNPVLPLILRSGEVSQISSNEELLGAPDFHSGYSEIVIHRTISSGKQSINFTALTLDQVLTLDGDLWLA